MKGLLRGGSHSRKEDKELLEQLERERQRVESEKRKRLVEFNRQTREANKAKAQTNPHRLAWGVDQRQYASAELRQKQREVEEQRVKRRAEREEVQRQGRTRIGLDLIPDFKYPKKTQSVPKTGSPPHSHAAKKTDPAVLEFMQEKRKRLVQAERQKALDQQELEDRRSRALARLQVHQQPRPKRRRKKPKKSTSKSRIQPTPEAPMDKNLCKKLRDMLRSKAQQLRESPASQPEDLHASLLRKMDELSTKLAQTKVLMARDSISRSSKHSLGSREEQRVSDMKHAKEDAAARLIQRFFRHLAEKRKAVSVKGAEKTLQLSELELPTREKEVDSDVSFKSFGSFLEKKEALRPADSLDLLTRENPVGEEAEEARADLVDHFRSSLDAHYLHLTHVVQPPPSDVLEDPSLLNTMRSSAAADEYNPSIEEESLGWDQHPVQRVEQSASPSVSEESGGGILAVSPMPTVPETGGSPTDSYSGESPLREFTDLHERGSPQDPSPPMSDYVGDSPRSFDDFFEPRIALQEIDSPRLQATSLRIPNGRRLALDLGRLAVPPVHSAEASGEESASIGSLIRDGPESPEVLSFRDNFWREIKSEQVDYIVQEVISRECEAIAGLVAPYVIMVEESQSDLMVEFILSFLDLLLAELQPREFQFMHRFSRPRPVDPLDTLRSLSTSVAPSPEKDVLISDAIFSRVCAQFNIKENPLLAPLSSLMMGLVREALELLRPESEKGEPPPWRQGRRDTRKQYLNLESVLCDVRDLLLFWNQAQIGQILLEEAPEGVAQVREELLTDQLMRDVGDKQMLSEESHWVDYEREEVHVKLDLADAVLSALVQETLQVLRG